MLQLEDLDHRHVHHKLEHSQIITAIASHVTVGRKTGTKPMLIAYDAVMSSPKCGSLAVKCSFSAINSLKPPGKSALFPNMQHQRNEEEANHPVDHRQLGPSDCGVARNKNRGDRLDIKNILRL